MRLLFVAADAMEFSGLLPRLRDVEKVPLRLDWVRSGRLGEDEVLLVANGVGRERAGEATEQGWLQLRPDAVISTGFCGALDDRLRVADIVSATSVNATPAQRLTGSRPCHHGAVRSIDRVASTAAEKAELRSSGACAVEMEAAAVSEKAEAKGVPFYCVRAVTDLAGEDMANDFNAALRCDGHFDTMVILTGVMRRPAVRLPELLRLRKRCIEAARGLGDFFADCRF